MEKATNQKQLQQRQVFTKVVKKVCKKIKKSFTILLFFSKFSFTPPNLYIKNKLKTQKHLRDQ